MTTYLGKVVLDDEDEELGRLGGLDDGTEPVGHV